MEIVESELIAQIHRAFSGVELEDGVSLNMTEFFDSGGRNSRFEEMAAGDERVDWASIADETLEQFTVTFCFTDLKGYRFYLPAYMTWFIRNHRSSRSIIAETTIHAIDPTRHQFDEIPFVDWFKEGQIQAMKKFLKYAGPGETWALENLGKIVSAEKIRS